MRVRFWFLMPGVWKRPKTARHQTRYVSQSDAEPPSDRQPVYWRLTLNHQARPRQTSQLN